MKTFGHLRPIRSRGTGAVINHKASPAQARTRAALGSAFGPDREHRLIVTLADGDLIVLRPERTARPIAIAAVDVYRWALLCRSNLARLEKARAAKAAKAERNARRRLEAAERRLFGRGAAPRHA